MLLAQPEAILKSVFFDRFFTFSVFEHILLFFTKSRFFLCLKPLFQKCENVTFFEVLRANFDVFRVLELFDLFRITYGGCDPANMRYLADSYIFEIFAVFELIFG